MFYYDSNYGYIWINREEFGGHVLHGMGPSKPFEPDSVEPQRYSSRDKHSWHEVDAVPDEWLEAFGIVEAPEPEEVVGPSTIYDIRIARPRFNFKTWHVVFATIVLIGYRIWVWNLHK